MEPEGPGGPVRDSPGGPVDEASEAVSGNVLEKQDADYTSRPIVSKTWAASGPQGCDRTFSFSRAP